MTAEEAARNLALIREVIERSRAERARSGDIYLVWGLAILVSDAITIGAQVLAGFPHGWVAFLVLTPLAAIYATAVGWRRSLRLSTFGSRVEGQLWTFSLLSMTAVLGGGAAAGEIGLQHIVPLVSSVLGVAHGTAGALFGSRLATGSGLAFVAVAGASFFLSVPAQHALFLAAMVVGYVVPGVRWIVEERRIDA